MAVLNIGCHLFSCMFVLLSYPPLCIFCSPRLTFHPVPSTTRCPSYFYTSSVFPLFLLSTSFVPFPPSNPSHILIFPLFSLSVLPPFYVPKPSCFPCPSLLPSFLLPPLSLPSSIFTLFLLSLFQFYYLKKSRMMTSGGRR